MGAKVILIVPPEEGFGDEGAGEDIPGDATLNFNIEIIGKSVAPNVFEEFDTDKNGVISKEEFSSWFENVN